MAFLRPPHWCLFLQALWRFVRRPRLEAQLVRAVKSGNTSRLAQLVDTHAWPLDTHLTPLPTTYTRHLHRAHSGHTLLHVAAQHGKVEVAECLLARGASPEAYTDFGWRVSHMAAVNGHHVILSLLAQRGADLHHELPSTSTFWEEHYVGPTATELVKEATGVTYQGNEYQAYRAGILGHSLPELGVPSTHPPRSRL